MNRLTLVKNASGVRVESQPCCIPFSRSTARRSAAVIPRPSPGDAIAGELREFARATFLLPIADLCYAWHGGEFDLPMRRGDMAEFLGLRLSRPFRAR